MKTNLIVKSLNCRENEILPGRGAYQALLLLIVCEGCFKPLLFWELELWCRKNSSSPDGYGVADRAIAGKVVWN
jgi:hypothetical protein